VGNITVTHQSNELRSVNMLQKMAHLMRPSIILQFGAENCMVVVVSNSTSDGSTPLHEKGAHSRYLSWNMPNHLAPSLDGHCIRIHWIPVLSFTRQNFSSGGCPNVFANMETMYTTVHHV